MIIVIVISSPPASCGTGHSGVLCAQMRIPCVEFRSRVEPLKPQGRDSSVRRKQSMYFEVFVPG